MKTRVDWKEAIDWIDDRTGLPTALRQCLQRVVPGGGRLGRLWPSMIAFTFVVQVITGLVLWMHYSPGAQSAWESVYYFQYEVAGGWLIRGVHHYAAQVLVALVGLYLVQMILSGAYRRPREFVFWTAVLMGLFSLALCLTGDLLAWDQNSYWATQTRVNFFTLLPGIGGWLWKLAAGGPSFGHLTLTRFFALHVGLFAAGLLVLLLLHGWVSRRAAAAVAGDAGEGVPYWPNQVLHNARGWAAVMLVVLLLVFQHAFSGHHADQRPGDYLGVPLGAPADTDPANAYAAARPEWSFRGLYAFTHLFPGGLQILAVFVFPGLVVLFVLAMPLSASWRRGHAANVTVFVLLVVGLVWLSWGSYREDVHDPEYQAAIEEADRAARRAKELAKAQGIPVAGAVTLLRTDPKTEGPRLCEQHCAVCHDYSAPEGRGVTTEAPSAPELYGFASREWIAGFLDPEKIKGPDYYGNTKFASGVMVRYVEGRFAWLDREEQTAIIAALSAEAEPGDQAEIEKGKQLIVQRRCTRCHRFHDEGPQGSAPDLTGYGSQEWIMGIVMDPSHGWFYGARNDRMPAYLETPEEPTENRLTAEQLQLVADWLRGQWYEPGGPNAGRRAKPDGQPKATPPMLTVATWASRRIKPAEAPPDTPDARARALYRREHCFICHGHTGGQGEPIVSAEPSAADLGGFASKEWITGLLDPKQVSGPKYFGNSVFANDSMAKFVRGNLRELVDDLEEEDKGALAKLIAAVADQAKRDAPADPDDVPDETKYLFEDFTCTDCHKFYDLGEANLGIAPDLTGYGSRDWIVGLLSDPTHKRFYGSKNDGMPSYRMSEDDPQKNLLTSEEAALLADWLRGVDGAKAEPKEP